MVNLFLTLMAWEMSVNKKGNAICLSIPFSISLASDQKQSGISGGMDGYEAVLMWNVYQSGDERALERFIQYNSADIVHLKPLMERGYEEMKTQMLSFNE